MGFFGVTFKALALLYLIVYKLVNIFPCSVKLHISGVQDPVTWSQKQVRVLVQFLNTCISYVSF